ncbi:hypothetical protein DPEC_G00182120 [Dallia pectoralis]|uniref:Uncharacterized protein n=1 Tax=Dallia pectoralis TaxID=75939 RepID=A0ACC2GAQ4_DALPE|nr:hypothetical protein DPEC_G00182120 [Dallia pectoralis]
MFLEEAEQPWEQEYLEASEEEEVLLSPNPRPLCDEPPAVCGTGEGGGRRITPASNTDRSAPPGGLDQPAPGVEGKLVECLSRSLQTVCDTEVLEENITHNIITVSGGVEVMMREFILTVAVLTVIQTWSLDVDSKMVDFRLHGPNPRIPLDMVPNSVDDMYDGCTDQMYNKVKTQYLPSELHFNTAWTKAVSCAKDVEKRFKKDKEKDFDPDELPHDRISRSLQTVCDTEVLEENNTHIYHHRFWFYRTTGGVEVMMREFILTAAVLTVFQTLDVNPMMIPLDWALQSVDDMYDGCTDSMNDKVKTQYLPSELKQHFNTSWTKAESCAKKVKDRFRRNNETFDPTELPHDRAYLKSYPVMGNHEKEVLIPPFEETGPAETDQETGQAETGQETGQAETGQETGQAETDQETGQAETDQVVDPAGAGLEAGQAETGHGVYPAGAGQEVYPAGAGQEVYPAGAGQEVYPAGAGQEVYPAGAGQEVYPEDTGQVATPEETGQEAAPEDTGQEAAPEDTGQEAAPEDTGQEAAPEDTGQEAGPEDTGQEAGPEDTGQEAGPEDTVQVAVPEDTVQVAVPEDTVQVAVPEDTVQVAVPEDTVQVAVPEDTVQVAGELVLARQQSLARELARPG